MSSHQSRVEPPHWPFHLAPPADWPALNVIGAIAVVMLLLALVRAVLNYIYNIGVAMRDATKDAQWLAG